MHDSRTLKRTQPGDKAQRRPPLIKDTVRYKTALCENWSASGSCPYGFKCQFAHGQSELRVRANISNENKKKVCVTIKGNTSRGEAPSWRVVVPSSAPPTEAPPAPPQPLLINVPPAPAPNGVPPAPAPVSASPPPISAPQAPVPRPAPVSLPPGLGLAPRKTVRWQLPAIAVADALALPSPVTPPAKRRGQADENDEPQAPLTDADLACTRDAPRVCRRDSGVPSKVGLNPLTGAVEVTRLGRQPSDSTSSVRRQLSLLFKDELDEAAAADPVSSAIWHGAHEHFDLERLPLEPLPLR